MAKKIPTLYYLYVISDPRTGKPLYVGKGCRDRMTQHWERYVVDPRRKHINHRLRAAFWSITSEGFESPIYEKWFESDDEDFIYWTEIYVRAFLDPLFDSLCNRDRDRGGRWWEKEELRQQRLERKKLTRSARADQSGSGV
jgi:hypothetical protein